MDIKARIGLAEINGGTAMTTSEIIKMAYGAMVLGVNYNGDTIEAVITAGYDAITDGAVLAVNGKQRLVKRGQDVACEIDGVEVKRMQVGDKRDKMLAHYALAQASK